MTSNDDKALQRFLDGKDELSQVLRPAPDAAPPPALDEAILAAARTEAARPMRPRWLVPMSVAATIVLGAGLTLKLQDQRPLTMSESDMTVSAPADIVTSAGGRQALAEGAPIPRPSVEAVPKLAFEDDVADQRADIDSAELARDALKRVRSAPTQFEVPSPAPPVVAQSAPRAAPAPVESEADSADIAGDLESGLSAGTSNNEVIVTGYRQASEERVAAAAEREAAAAAKTLGRRSSSVSDTAGQRLGQRSQAAEDKRLAEMASARSMDMSFAPAPGDLSKKDIARELGFQAGTAPALPDLTDEDIERVLDSIRSLHEAGDVELAQQRLSVLAKMVDDLELPDDFPLPLPERALADD